jgi:hypothetical protein
MVERDKRECLYLVGHCLLEILSFIEAVKARHVAGTAESAKMFRSIRMSLGDEYTPWRLYEMD